MSADLKYFEIISTIFQAEHYFTMLHKPEIFNLEQRWKKLFLFKVYIEIYYLLIKLHSLNF